MSNIRKVFKQKILLYCIFLIALFNELTLGFVDPNPPLNYKILITIRIFDFSLIFLGLLSTVINTNKFFHSISIFGSFVVKRYQNLITTIFFYIILFIILDICLSFFNFGYPKHFIEANMQRAVSPYDYFNGKPNALDHNNLGFRGKFKRPENLEQDTLTIAFFGGSTGYKGNPPIPDIIGQKLREEGIKVETYNFSSVSSNHTQHVHRLVKYIFDFKFDFIIFYGGGNETLQYQVYDPRVGFPYNFFYRSELGNFTKLLLENSSIIGEIDKYTKLISGLSKLKNKFEMTSPGRYKEIIDQYEKDISLAAAITQGVTNNNYCTKGKFFSIGQPANPLTMAQVEVWNEFIEYSINRELDLPNSHLDLSKISNEFEYVDTIHFADQKSREIIANKISEYIKPKIKECRKD